MSVSIIVFGECKYFVPLNPFSHWWTDQGIAAEEDIIAHIVKMNDSQFPGQDEFIIDDIMTVFLASVSNLNRAY